MKAVKDGREFKSPRPPSPQAKFRVLDEAKADELAQARRAYGSSHLTLGLLYAQAGLLYEAELEFRALLKANPDSAPAKRLLKRVRGSGAGFVGNEAGGALGVRYGPGRGPER